MNDQITPLTTLERAYDGHAKELEREAEPRPMGMQKSKSINKLAAALAKAQGEMAGARKGSTNPDFQSKYADLASVWDACREALSQNGLAVLQSPNLIQMGDGVWGVSVETFLIHSSGQFMAGVLVLPVAKPDAQGVGSAVTYAKRYSLASFVGVAPEDDDGNAAVAAGPAPPPVRHDRAPSVPPGALETATCWPVSFPKPLTGVNGRGAWTKFQVKGKDGQVYSTFEKRHVEVANEAAENLWPVDITYRTTKYGREIAAIQGQVLGAPTEQPDEKEIPF